MQRASLWACLLLALLGAALAARPVAFGEQHHGGRQLLDRAHNYGQGERVPLWASKVGPFSNPRRVLGGAMAAGWLASGPAGWCDVA